MLKKVKRYVKDPYYALGNDMIKRCPKLMSDKFYLSVLWKLVMGYKLDWKHPSTFCEKLQWLKLYDRNPLYTLLVDKYRVKDWVAGKIGEQFVIPTLAVYQSTDEINLEELPEQFVLKCNHDSGSVVICRDKSKFDMEAAKKKLDACLKHNFYWDAREWPYKRVATCIMAEHYVTPEPGMKDLPDYKWYCFNGEPRFCQVIQGRSTKETIDFFDLTWEHQEFVGLNPACKSSVVCPQRPVNIDVHLKIARELSKGLPFSRIDLYEIGGQVYFGEITLFPRAGLGSFNPAKYNGVFGDLLTLPYKM